MRVVLSAHELTILKGRAVYRGGVGDSSMYRKFQRPWLDATDSLND